MGRANHSATPVAMSKKSWGAVIYLSYANAPGQNLKLITKKVSQGERPHSDENHSKPIFPNENAAKQVNFSSSGFSPFTSYRERANKY